MHFSAGSGLNAVGRCWGVKEGILLRDFILELTNRAEVVKNPKGAAVGRDHKGVVFDDQIVHRGSRQVRLQSTPVRSVIKVHINTIFRSAITRSELLGI